MKDELGLREERWWKSIKFKWNQPWELWILNHGRSIENTSTTSENSDSNTTYREFDDRIFKSNYVTHFETHWQQGANKLLYFSKNIRSKIMNLNGLMGKVSSKDYDSIL